MRHFSLVPLLGPGARGTLTTASDCLITLSNHTDDSGVASERAPHRHRSLGMIGADYGLVRRGQLRRLAENTDRDSAVGGLGDGLILAVGGGTIAGVSRALRELLIRHVD